MSTRTRIVVLLAVATSGFAIAVVSLLRMLIPGFLDTLPGSLVGRLGTGVELALSLTGALAVLGVTGFAVAMQRGRGGGASARAVRGASLLAAALVAVTMPGGVIPAAGYTFALTVILGIVVFVTLTVIRRPWLGIPLAGLVIGGLVFAAVNLEAAALPLRVVGALLGILPQVSLALAHVVAAAGLLIWVIADGRSDHRALAAFVHGHRTPITLIAAACALPYAVARASWLTPWPLFGGSAEMFAEDPSTRATGLALGLAMLIGGLLTLGLILPWGERFPRFLAGIGGRAVPPALAIIPASVVSVLFTAASAEFTLTGVGNAQESVYLLLVFPFWLWGPMLGFAAWGYAMHRADSSRSRRSARVAAEDRSIEVLDV
ncbi:hypothetical protein ABS642_18720 [Microbacterium sp. A8/3-1]|uniref:Integral membrane protein n=1 Tax=Microbacterium sp. A8/3-1 TaxID=3160749 RepID=A0AAU7VU09_9MICO